jgi:hypothetical protein
MITHDECEYLDGAGGIVWATYDRYQAEIIQSALLAQKIACELQETSLTEARRYLLHVAGHDKVEAALDFIWRDQSGLRLRPDWWYPAGSVNESFRKWVEER